jgi:hypothetical protein
MKSKSVSIPTTVEAQIRTRARNLPIHQCYINRNWEDERLATIIVVRKHTSGSITRGHFVVDLKLRGITDCMYIFNETPLHLDDLLKSLRDPLVECDYHLAHNIVYAGLAFAEDYGFSPHKSFKTAQYILEEDTDDIPMMEITPGDNGIPVLQIPYGETGEREMAILDKTAAGDYHVVYLDKDGNPERKERTYLEIMNEMVETGLDGYFEKHGDQKTFRESLAATDLIYMAHVYTDEDKGIIDHEYNRIIKDPRLLMQDEQIINHHEEELAPATKYFYEGKTDKAAEETRKIIDKYPDEPLLWDLFLYNLSVDIDEVDEETVKEAYSRFPDHPAIRAWYAEWLAQNERADEVLALFNHIPGLDALTHENRPINGHALISFCYAYAMAWLQKEDVPRAEPYYQMIVTLEFDSRLSEDIQEMMIELKGKKIDEMVDAEKTD